MTGEVSEGTLAFGRFRTWYRVTGNGEVGRLPVVVLHGGPGLAHYGCLAMQGLASDGRQVVHYDQIGCGRSTHLPDAGEDFWTIDLFRQELENVVEQLDLSGGYHLVGHSWGGMLGAEYALDRPSGLASLTICNSPASMELWAAAAEELRKQLPAEVRDKLDRHEAAGTLEDPEYLRAVDFVYDKHFCRVQPRPQELRATLEQMEADPTVYLSMNGPNEFHVTGTLRDWSIIDRLDGIDVPTLVIAGEYDEATPETWRPYVERIPDSREHVFSDASHTPHIEQTEAFLDVVGSFLREHDAEV